MPWSVTCTQNMMLQIRIMTLSELQKPLELENLDDSPELQVHIHSKVLHPQDYPESAETL